MFFLCRLYLRSLLRWRSFLLSLLSLCRLQRFLWPPRIIITTTTTAAAACLPTTGLALPPDGALAKELALLALSQKSQSALQLALVGPQTLRIRPMDPSVSQLLLS